MVDDLRAVLEAVVYGDDPRITPAERVRAAEQLRALAPPVQRDFHGVLAGMDPGAEAPAAWGNGGGNTGATSATDAGRYDAPAEAAASA